MSSDNLRDMMKNIPNEKKTILVVEDEYSVRTVIARILKSRGFEAIVAVDGIHALEVAKTIGVENIDLVITDVIMPQKNGVELAKELRAMYNDLKILFISGYNLYLGDNSDNTQEVNGFLGKPFTTEELFEQIDKLID